MGHKHEKADILAGAVEVARAHGLSRVSFGRVARHLDINDRTVVYYFPSKDDLLGEVLVALGADLQEKLLPAFTTAATDHRTLARSAWPVLARTDADPAFALFFEATGLAAAGREPFRTLVPQLVDAWVDWVAELIDLPEPQRRPEAEAAIALLDGLLLLRQLVGAEAADRAAGQLEIARTPPAQRQPAARET